MINLESIYPAFVGALGVYMLVAYLVYLGCIIGSAARDSSLIKNKVWLVVCVVVWIFSPIILPIAWGMDFDCKEPQ